LKIFVFHKPDSAFRSIKGIIFINIDDARTALLHPAELEKELGYLEFF
jgi:hypothetical protein